MSENSRPAEISPRIFKAYDIRGVVDDTLTETAVTAVACAFADMMRESGMARVVVGRDGRLSSERLQTALMQGLQGSGVDVVDIGLCTSPMLYFATHWLGTGTGIQITGSHNPPAYNGLKLMLGGATLYGDAVQDIRRRVMTQSMMQRVDNVQALPLQGVKQQRVFDAYQNRIVSDVRLKRPMRVAIDAGNGVAGAFAGNVFRALGCEVTELFCEVDGRFPNHHPDPSKAENLQDLVRCLAAGDAEVGLAFDGDADRLGVVTKDGTIIDADRLLMLFARDVLARNAGATIVFDVKCSRLLGALIRECGGDPLMWKTGHSMLKAKLKETASPLAGEMSGHFFFGERWYGFDDGIYAGARLLEILSRFGDASTVLNALPLGVSTPEIQTELPEGESFAVVEKLKRTAHFPDAVSVSDIDGLRVDFADGFGLVRASNTTPVLTVRFEADTQQRLYEIQDAFRRAIELVAPAVRW